MQMPAFPHTGRPPNGPCLILHEYLISAKLDLCHNRISYRNFAFLRRASRSCLLAGLRGESLFLQGLGYLGRQLRERGRIYTPWLGPLHVPATRTESLLHPTLWCKVAQRDARGPSKSAAENASCRRRILERRRDDACVLNAIAPHAVLALN